MLSTIPKIVCDQYIPFLVEAVQTAWPQVQICPMKPEQIDASAVREADVLVIRTRTQVNEALLSGSRVRLVCTATIGFDHIDTAYCDAHGIQWMSCPGCNAQAVCDYIEQAIDESKSSNLSIFQSSNTPTIGVVGVGHVGSLVAKMASRRIAILSPSTCRLFVRPVTCATRPSSRIANPAHSSSMQHAEEWWTSKPCSTADTLSYWIHGRTSRI